jgi:hypothetical protein
MWQERAGTLANRLALAESRLAALEAPQERHHGTLDAPGAPQAQEPSTGEPSPPWWRSWARWWPAALAVLIVLVGAGALLIAR